MKQFLGSFVRTVVLLVLAATLATEGCARKRLEFTLVFKDANGLRTGQFVTYKGVRVGEVTSVAFDPEGKVRVGVRIEPDHAKMVYREAKFSIEKTSGAVDVTGERRVQVTDRGDARSPVQRGDVLQGSDGFVSEFAESVGKASRTISSAMSDLKAGVDEMARELSSSPGAKDFIRQSRDLVDEAGRLSAEQARDFKEKKLPELRKKAIEIRNEMEKNGKKADAKAFWDSFVKWTESVTR